MKSIKLYTTSGCHLCEQAQALLHPYVDMKNLTLDLIEISISEDLIAQYGVRIPVLSGTNYAGEMSELAWPFDATELASWLQTLRVK
ncbi:Glutaredoxin-like domain [Allopseudospirillum japonicum]|uniref:Glutaredoxin-like domain n=1 Tax=Allopseudospirillum japonicum TaxID=64971 RepID=A0A1H6T753_9GAMM|nr:glutaredoxin family protein [Allopseudospirillum japonicum]SEI75868.1 Glutaredoxin-like domain [Allopseudospirillum japonicum]